MALLTALFRLWMPTMTISARWLPPPRLWGLWHCGSSASRVLLQNVVMARARGETAELFYERARKHDDGDERAGDFEGLIAGEGDGSGLTVDDCDAVGPGGHLRHVGGEEGELQARRGGELRRQLGQGGGEGGAGAFVDALTGDGRVQTLG